MAFRRKVHLNAYRRIKPNLGLSAYELAYNAGGGSGDKGPPLPSATTNLIALHNLRLGRVMERISEQRWR